MNRRFVLLRRTRANRIPPIPARNTISQMRSASMPDVPVIFGQPACRNLLSRQGIRSPSPALGLLGGAQQDLTHERLRRLGHDGGDCVCHVAWLQHPFGFLSFVTAEVGVDRSWADYR